MMKNEQLGNVLVAEVLDKKLVVRASQNGIETTVMKNDELVSTNEVSAFNDELLEVAHEAVLESVLNNVFGDLEEGTDELLEALESELESYLQKLIQDGSGSLKHLH
ncbi:hypothetical protein [Anoxybacteroides rupiense]|uniref:hypothetical protein n=1 Tax=Anoxybacteroides rupiense TaxID=311460 RepID=UPI001605FF01|nr:hypothetical protein [Anoxybacillus rupiensis]MBB3908477.1 hypothetical protein [Anoxybacillus rupiensis]